MAKAKVTEKNIKLILHGSIGKAILALAVPVVINSFLQTMYNLTDTYWLGQLGTNELAAINLVSPLQQIVVNFGSGLTVAGAVLIAQLIGASKKEEAASMASQIFVCAMIFSIICAGVIAIFTPTVVNWIGADEPTAKVANVYLRLVILDMPFLYMVNIFAAIRQAQGDTVSPMFLNLTGILLNVVLDPLLMIVINWGAAGQRLRQLLLRQFRNDHRNLKEINRCMDRLKGFRFEKQNEKHSHSWSSDCNRRKYNAAWLFKSRNVYVYGTEQWQHTEFNKVMVLSRCRQMVLSQQL
ncbi:MAG: MATE family efflux transporter [Lachnospiraceae bacterium]